MRTLPQPCIDETGTVLDVPVVHRGFACRLDVRTGVLTRKSAERHRRVRRAKSRGADSRDRAIQLFGEQRQADDVACLALVGAHSERRVTLKMLDRLITLMHCERDVAHRDIVLQVDEALGPPISRGDAPERAEPTGRDGLSLWCKRRFAATKTGLCRGLEARGMAVRQRVSQIRTSVYTAGGQHR